MADCGATGSALDRTVRAMGGGQGHGDASKVLGSLLGQTSLAEPHAMPTAAPHTLVMPPYNVSLMPPPPQQQQQQPPMPPTAAAAQQHAPHTAMMQQQQQPQHHNMHHPGMAQMNPYMQMQQHQHHQQQQMMMMMNMQMQQQQHMIMAQQQQQQQQHHAAQQQAAQKHAAAKQTETNFLDQKEDLDQETQDALREHLESLHQQGHEGLVKGAGIDELAAAWAEAEAAYEQEAAVEQATNMAAAVETKEQYVFHHQSEEAPPDVASVDWMDEGMRHFRQGHVRQAIRCFETQLQHCNNDDSRAWRMLGKCHAENDQDREAILCLEQAVDRDPYNTDALLALAVSHVNELNHQRALSNLKAWITHNPKYAGMELTDDLYGDTAAVAAKGGDVQAFDEVQRLLLRALEYDPSNSSEILQTLGVTCKFLCGALYDNVHVKCSHFCHFLGIYLLLLDNVNRDYEAAVNAFRRALDERPDDYQLWNKLGATLANGNQSEKALPAYNRALELRPRYARGWLNMAISYSNLQNYEEAARCYLQTLSLNPAATHCWSYLRIALSCSEKWDLIPLAAAQDLAPFREHYDFVLHDQAAPATPAPSD